MWTHRSFSRPNLTRKGPSTPTNKKCGLFKNGSISSKSRRSVVTKWLNQFRVVWSSISFGEEKVDLGLEVEEDEEGEGEGSGEGSISFDTCPLS